MSDTLELRGVLHRRGGTLAVDRVSFTLRRGEFFSLLGPSGSGKTSTLRLIAGFEAPDEGDILIGGRSMAGVPANRRPVNLVFQQYALFPHLTVQENVAFGLEMAGVARESIAPRVQAALEMVRLPGKAGRKPVALSGGEQQRVALARALVNRPTVVLLDEPLGALDQQLRQEMQIELKRIQAESGITFLYVTHHQEEALTMSDRVAVMQAGRIVQIGTPHEIYERPRTAFVASFIGLSNTVKTAGAATMVIRPERLRLSDAAESGRYDHVLPARVEQAVYSGNETHYWLRLADETQWRARVTNAGDAKPYHPGQSVYVHWNTSDTLTLTE
ncbi:MAG TPA: ABC transporter ATP-binding protein [Nitrospirales bacterium]|nr:ABC transporter ATP-binding protein [Nitrospirales bacterium]